MSQHYDPWSIVVIALTLVLFGVALFEKGFTHDILLEAGVFLVSAKLIIMSHKNSILAYKIEKHMDQIESLLKERKS